MKCKESPPKWTRIISPETLNIEFESKVKIINLNAYGNGYYGESYYGGIKIIKD